MADPNTNVTEDGEPGDLSAAATDEFGGPEEIAADDAGTGALEGNVGKTAGGQAPLGVGGQASPVVEGESGAAVIAADDAGAGRAAAKELANGSGAD
jgi:hypothetical protein